jgi:hypothetical protein
MANPTLDSLITPPTVTEVKASIYASIAALGVNTTLWKPGAVVRAITAACSILIAAALLLVSKLARMGFLSLSEGDWLTQVAYYVYGVERIEASNAATQVTFTNASGGEYNEDAGDVQVAHATTGKVYQTTESLVLAGWSGSGPKPTSTVWVEALEAGTASNAAAGTITTMVSQLIGVTCTNAAAAVAMDDESDPALQAECSEKIDSASPNGPLGSYEWAAKRKGIRVDGSLVPITSVSVSPPVGDNTVTVFVAGPDGSVSGAYTDPTTDLGAVHQGIQLWAEPIGITEITQSASSLTVNLTYSLDVDATITLSNTELDALIQSALASFFSTQPVGGWEDIYGDHWVYGDAIERTIGSVDSLIVRVYPISDVPVTTGQIPTIGTVTQDTVRRVTR